MVQPAKWQRMCKVPAASIADNFMKLGYQVGTDAVEASTTDTVLVATAHAAQAGDTIVMTSGGEDGEARVVASVDANNITLESALSGAPSATETFAIVRPIQVKDPTVWIHLRNSTNQAVEVSFDGSTTHMELESSGGARTVDLCGNNRKLANRRPTGQDQVGVANYVWVKTESTAPTNGSVFLEHLT